MVKIKEKKPIHNNLWFEKIPSKFKLIENHGNRMDVFVCVNEDAVNVFKEYKMIVDELSGIEKKNAFLKIKNKFYQYVISVDEKDFGAANIINDEIGVIFPDDLNFKYSFDVGFIISEKEEPMIW